MDGGHPRVWRDGGAQPRERSGTVGTHEGARGSDPCLGPQPEPFPTRNRSPQTAGAANHEAKRDPHHHPGPDAHRRSGHLAAIAARTGRRRRRPAPPSRAQGLAHGGGQGRQAGGPAQGRHRAPDLSRHPVGARAGVPPRRATRRASPAGYAGALRADARGLLLAGSRARRRGGWRQLSPDGRPAGKDRRRDQEHLRAGRAPLRVTHGQVFFEPATTAALLADVFTDCRCRRGSASSKRAA
jgi:hypothetical protein